MGFELPEEFEEIPYSLGDYLLQPIRLSAKIFRAIVIKPKLKYWIIALLVGSLFTWLGTWMLYQKIEINIIGGGSIPEEALQAAEGLFNVLMKNPAVTFLEASLSELLMQIIVAFALFVLIKLMSGKGGFSSALMVSGLESIPSILSGLLMAYLGYIMPPVTLEINLSASSLGGPGIGLPEDLQMQQSEMSLLISLWTAMIVYLACRYGFGIGKGKSLISSAVIWLLMNFTIILGLL